MSAGLAQSVQCLATFWKTGRSRFDPRQRRKDFSCNLCVQTSSGAHPASCTVGNGGSSPPGIKRGRGVTLTTHPHLVPRSRMSRSCTPLPSSAFLACSGTALAFMASDMNSILLKLIKNQWYEPDCYVWYRTQYAATILE
jgi:hypothetical protein